MKRNYPLNKIYIPVYSNIFDYFLSRTNTNSKWWKIKPKIQKVPKNSTKPYNLNALRDPISKRGWLGYH